MTIIGTCEEIADIRNQCDGRCVDGHWCIFGFQKNACPVDSSDGCLEFKIIKAKDGTYFSFLNKE